MADLSDRDYRIIIGDDYKRRMNDTALTATSTNEERRAERAKRAQRSADLQFSFGAVVVTGIALLGGALYTGLGVGSVQAICGAVIAVAGVAGIVYATRKIRLIKAESTIGI